MKIKIFLASSKELEKERLVFADLVGHLNNALESRDITISLVKWEYIDASMGPEHKQEEYNEQLRDCDLCIVLYWTTFGKWTKMELDTAYEEKCAGRNPKKLYVYFKDGEQISEDLQKFRDSFPENYGHFFTDYKNIDTLKAHFLLQFMDYLSNNIKDSGVIEIHGSKVVINGKPYVELSNVPIVANNDKYNQLLKTIDDKQTILSLVDKSHPKYSEYKTELENARNELHQIEESIWDTALLVTSMSNEKNSKNLQLAIDLLNQGDNKGAQALLLSENDESDIAQNMKLIKLGEEGQKGIKDIINKKRLLIKTYENEMSEGWIDQVISLRKQIADISKEAFGKESLEYATALDALGHTYYIHGKDEFAEETYSKAFVIFETDRLNKTPEYATLLIHVGDLYMRKEMFLRAQPYYLDALELIKEKFGDSSISYALPLYKMGCHYSIFNMFDHAKECLEDALNIIEGSKGDNVLLHSQILRELALCYAQVSNDYDEERTKTYSKDEKELYQQACSLINKSINLIETNYGKNNSTYVHLQKRLSDILKVTGHREEAESVLLNALELSKDINDHHETYDYILHAIGYFYYLGEKEKAEALGFDYSSAEAKDIPIFINDDKRWVKKMEELDCEKTFEEEFSSQLASLYMKKFPREKSYSITLSSETDDGSVGYFELSDKEIDIFRSWEENPVIDDVEYGLNEFLELKGYEDLIDKICDSYYYTGYNTLVNCDMNSYLKFTDFSIRTLKNDGTISGPSYSSISLSDEEYFDLLKELIGRKNNLSVNMLVFMKPELGKKIMWKLTPDWRTEPFVCEMCELKEAVINILDPFKDVLHIFDSTNKDIKKFAIKHQILENSNDEIFDKTTDNDNFHVEAYFEGKILVLSQYGYIFGGMFGTYHDQDEFRIDAQKVMTKFGLNKPEQIIPYIKDHFGTRDAISQIRDIFEESKTTK